MQLGVFIPIGNNGWLISETSPQYMPTFELNKEIVQKAEGYGLDFCLSMIKLRGFGGKTQFWEHNLESFTLMAGLAAVTDRIKIFATAATLTIPPAIVARMASTRLGSMPTPGAASRQVMRDRGRYFRTNGTELPMPAPKSRTAGAWPPAAPWRPYSAARSFIL